MDEKDLLSVLRQEEKDSSSYYDSELAQKQAEAMKRYNGEPYGDEVDGRSKVITRDVADTINWVMPHLMRTFAESDELVTVDDPGLEDDDQTLKDAQEYLKHVFFEDNEGEIALHDFVFDGLLQRVGVMRCAWEDSEPTPPEIVEGLSADALAKYSDDRRYELLEVEQSTQDGGVEPTFSAKVQKKPGVGRVMVEAIPPEEFRINRRAKSIERSDYHAWRHQVYLSEVMRDHPKARRSLDPTGLFKDADANADDASDDRRYRRFPDEPEITTSGSDRTQDAGRRKVWQLIEYLRIDYDEDGIVELRRVKRVGDTILENDAVDGSEFVAWSPIRISHRAIGESLAETLSSLQKIRTVLTRCALDSLNRSLLTTTVIDESAISKEGDTLGRLLDHDIGGVIPVKGRPGEVMMERVIPNVAGDALAAIEYFDRRSEEASGVNRHAQGIQPEAITQTKGGIELLQAAANSRVEQIARWAAIGLEEVFEKILRLLAAHQDQPRMLKFNGRRVSLDPRRWSDEMTVGVHVGMAAESRDKKLVNLNLIAQKQEAILMQAGPANPIVSLAEYANTLALLPQTMGFKNPRRFFRQVPPDYQPPQPQPDPKAAEAQAKLQLQQQEFAHKQEMSRAQAMIDGKSMQIKIDTEKAMAEAKLGNELRIAVQRSQMEERLAMMRMEKEIELAKWKAMLDADTAKEIAQIKGGSSAPTSADDGVGGAYRPGGKLDA